MLEYQRACPQENHPDVAGLHLRLPPLDPSCAFLSFFLTLTSSIPPPPPPPRSCPTSVLLSFDLPRTLSLLLLSRRFVPRSFFIPPSPLLSALWPLSLSGPRCCEIWFPCSQNCKASWGQRSRSEECAIEQQREGDRECCAADTRDHRRFTAEAPGSAVGAREIGWPSFHFSRSDIKHKQKGPRRWNKALMSRRLFSLEGTRSARANPWRYEIPIRMCLEWLVVRPLASIKPTAELLLVMPDILTAPGGADTRVFEVKHTGSHTRAGLCANTPTAIVLLAAIPSAVPNEERELLNKQKAANESSYLIFSLFLEDTPRLIGDWGGQCAA